jgi:hypothetical protein
MAKRTFENILIPSKTRLENSLHKTIANQKTNNELFNDSDGEKVEGITREIFNKGGYSRSNYDPEHPRISTAFEFKGKHYYADYWKEYNAWHERFMWCCEVREDDIEKNVRFHNRELMWVEYAESAFPHQTTATSL